MEKNMGSIDRIIRIVLSIVIVLLFFAGQITGTAAVILGIIAVCIPCNRGNRSLSPVPAVEIFYQKKKRNNPLSIQI